MHFYLFLKTCFNFRGTDICLQSELVPVFVGCRLKTGCVKEHVQSCLQTCDLENSSLLFKGVLTYKCERTKLSVWEAREADGTDVAMSAIVLDSPSKSSEIKSHVVMSMF